MQTYAKLMVPFLLGVSLIVGPLTLTSNAADEAPQVEPLAVVSITGSTELMSDFGYLSEAAGAGDFGRLIRLMASPYVSLLDKEKPSGLYILNASERNVDAVGFLPVKDLNALLLMLEDQVGKPRDVGDGVLEIATDKPQSMFVKEVKGWAFLSDKKKLLANVPKNPAKLLGGMDKEYVLAFRLNVQNLPSEMKEMAIKELRQGIKVGMRDVDDDDRETVEELAESFVQSWLDLLEGTEYLTIGWEVDSDNQTMHADIGVTAVKGSNLEQQLALIKDAKSQFAGFLLPDAAFTLHVNAASSDQEVQQVLLLMEPLREKMMEEIEKDDDLANDQERETATEIVGQLLDILEDTIEVGKTNFGAAIIAQPETLSFAAGGFVADGKKLADTIKRLSEFARQKEPDVPPVAFDVETHDGVAFHMVSIPMEDADDEARQLLGDPLEVVLGTGPKSVYLAFGKRPADLLKTVIDKSKQDADKKLAPAQASISFTPILELASSLDSNPAVRLALETIKQSAGKDHIAFRVVPVKNGCLARLEIEEGILKVIGEAARALAPMLQAARR